MLFIGTGVSGGEEGALLGLPSCRRIPRQHGQGKNPSSRRLPPKFGDGIPCCDWVGENGAGHFVKNGSTTGLEYGDMQLICEAYQVMRDLLG